MTILWRQETPNFSWSFLGDSRLFFGLYFWMIYYAIEETNISKREIFDNILYFCILYDCLKANLDPPPYISFNCKLEFKWYKYLLWECFFFFFGFFSNWWDFTWIVFLVTINTTINYSLFMAVENNRSGEERCSLNC